MSTPQFSIIVPIYKVENYLVECIESVLKQSNKNFELILVDDGSPDDSGNICDLYAKDDSRIKVIHKKNGGLSSARNAGLNKAVGDYVIFLDSDDFWNDEKGLEGIEKNLKETNADILLFPSIKYYGNDKSISSQKNMLVDRKKIVNKEANSAITYMLTYNIYRATAWDKVVRHSIIKENKMRFKEGYLSEDVDWCGDLLLYGKRFDFYNTPFYFYRQEREGSITNTRSEKLIADALYMCEKGYSQALCLNDNPKTELLASYYAYQYAATLGGSSKVKDEKILSRLKELQELLNFDISNKVKKVRKLKKIIGYTLTRKVLCFFVNHKK